MTVSVVEAICAIVSISVATNTLLKLTMVADQMVAIATFGTLLRVVTWARSSSLCKTVATSTHLQFTQSASRIQEESRTAREAPFCVIYRAVCSYSSHTIVASALVHPAHWASSR